MKGASSKDAFARAAQAICDLGLWDEASLAVWGLDSQLAPEPILCLAAPEKMDGPVAGHLFLFPGFTALRDYQLFRKVRDYGFASSPLDLLHDELLARRDGTWTYLSYEAGYLPWSPAAESRAYLAPLLDQCYGLMMRFEEDAQLAARFARENPGCVFARKEGLDGKWRDGALAFPDEKTFLITESVSLSKARCAHAAALPFAKDVVWEVDFIPFTALRTQEPRPRYPYALVAIDRASGKRLVWLRLTVDGKPEGLKRLWESLAAHLLDSVTAFGAVPGEIHVRSGRLMRFLRPLGLQLPFKLVLNAQLPAVDTAVAKALKEGTL